MKKEFMKIEILPNIYLKDDGTFDKEKAINLCGKIAGICYDKEGFQHLENEQVEKTNRRINMTLNNGHHSVYDHITINFNVQNIPKILAMILNNEHQYTTSEKSARYTPVVKTNDLITSKEELLYNKWLKIFKIKIKERYGFVYKDFRIEKLAQENAKYLVSVFMPTQMIYSTSLRQINYIASWMQEYINNHDKTDDFENKLSNYMIEFINELDRLNVLEDGLLKNEKERTFSLFGNNLDNIKEYFGDVYITKYEATFAYLAQAQRHRTLDYKMEFMKDKKYYIPEIIKDDPVLVGEWLNDMDSVKSVIPQGELIIITETGTYENFILKCKERLCTASQLEIMRKTKEILLKYKDNLELNHNELYKTFEKYSQGARCTFPDFTCSSPCYFKEGITLTRKI